MQSFGIMRVTMNYLSPHEQLWMQQINTWFYTCGAGRVQTRIILVRTKYFSSYYPHSFNHYLLAYTTGSDLVRLSCSNLGDYSSY